MLFNYFTLKQVHLDDYNGIDMLGNMMESSLVSIDREYYGDIHNMGMYLLRIVSRISENNPEIICTGHIFMAYAHDPEHRHLESFGVLGKFSHLCYL